MVNNEKGIMEENEVEPRCSFPLVAAIAAPLQPLTIPICIPKLPTLKKIEKNVFKKLTPKPILNFKNPNLFWFTILISSVQVFNYLAAMKVIIKKLEALENILANNEKSKSCNSESSHTHSAWCVLSWESQ